MAVIIFILAFFIRFYRLDMFPLNHDEAIWTLGSFGNFDKFMHIPVACFRGYIQPVFSFLALVSSKFFSNPLFIVRIPAVIIGSLTVFLLYELGKEAYNRKVGLIAALLLCFLPWHILHSRVGVSLILTPFFGCLIFLALFKSINKQSNHWFLIFCFLLALGSFYTYQASLLFIPISLIVLFAIRKEMYWLKIKIALFGFFIFVLTLYPIVHLYFSGHLEQYFGKVYRIYYNDEPFGGPLIMLFANIFPNFKTVFPLAIKALFIDSSGYILYGQTLKGFPLLVYWPIFLVVLFSVVISFLKRSISDIIVLIWLFAGLIGSSCGVRYFQDRYIIIILPAILLFIAKFVANVFDWASKKTCFRRDFCLFSGILLLSSFIIIAAGQYIYYCRNALYNLEECRISSYGCAEAARFLARFPNVEVVTDENMTVITYLEYFKVNDKIEKPRNDSDRMKIYYVLWAPESHPVEYWDGRFNMYERLKHKNPDLKPIKIIYYPNGMQAIDIFELNEWVEL